METERNYEIPVAGLDNEHSALMIHQKLSGLRGLSSFRIDTAGRKIVLSCKDPVQEIPALVNILKELGYDAERVRLNLPVLQMSCASCAVSVESILRSQPGVLKAEVNYASASVQTEFIASIIPLKEMQKAVRSIGYDLLITEEGLEAGNPDKIREAAYKRLKKKAAGAMLFAMPVMILGMFAMDRPYVNELMMVLSSAVIFLYGRSFFVNAWKQLRHRSANMDSLVAISTGIAYLYSVFNTLFPGFWHQRGLHGHVYFEAASVVIAFILTGKVLEEKAKGKTSDAIRKLMGLQANTVRLSTDTGAIIEVPLDEVGTGSVVLVRPGEKIALDGTVLSGSSYVDESSISGEPIPVLKNKDAKVFAGTINLKGSFSFRSEKIGSETMLARIIRVVQDAQGSKAPVQKLADRISAVFVPVVLATALLSFLVWGLLGGPQGWSQGLISFVTVLVIACPCALGLATPTAIMVGVGKGAGRGILIRDAESLEKARDIQVLIVDKTGTLTQGKPVLSDIVWLEGEEHNAGILKNIELRSEHPLAQAVANALADSSGPEIDEFSSITGMGAEAKAGGRKYILGRKALLETNKIGIDGTLSDRAVQWENEAKTVVWFADEHKALAVMSVSDSLKPGSAEAVARLQSMGIEVHMLTGDNLKTAEIIASQCGISRFQAGLMPEDKAAYVRELQQKGKTVAMVGDGINDSTALALADVSVAMGHGSDIAMDVARMCIISSDLRKLPEAIELSRQTMRTVKENLFWAFVYNVVGIPLAAGVLYPFNGFLLDPMLAGAAMALSSISVVGNSLRLKWKQE